MLWLARAVVVTKTNGFSLVVFQILEKQTQDAMEQLAAQQEGGDQEEG
jgi:hypothetical protein